MPVYYNSSTRKSSGFSIDDIIKSETLRKPSHPSTIVIPAMTCFPPTPALYQLQRESIFHFFRHASPYPRTIGSKRKSLSICHFDPLDPGAAVAAAYLLNSYRKPKRNRTAFTPTQLLKLENEFEKNHYIVGQERKDLAKHLNLPESKVNSIPPFLLA